MSSNPFLNFLANDIISWSDTIEARSQFAVLLRTLIHSTCRDIRKIDFPGNDDCQRPGWDGFMEATSATPWIPAGISGWEFGTNKEPKPQADDDFDKSIKAIPTATERKNITFVFVTSQRWPGKTSWANEKKQEGIWKDVRAYDASDLEQWLEQSLPARVWFANQIKQPPYSVRSLEQCWEDWANVTEPALLPCIFADAAAKWSDALTHFLLDKERKRLIISAESTEEGLAFLSQALDAPDLQQYRDRAVVIDKLGMLPQLCKISTDFIAVVHTRDVEQEASSIPGLSKTILIYPRIVPRGKPNILLDPPRFGSLGTALSYMDVPEEQIDELILSSGRSLTVLRRMLAKTPKMRTPVWAQDPEAAARLIPYAFAGAWDSRNEADRAILTRLGDVPYATLSERAVEFLQLSDSPLWSCSGIWGAVSQTDFLFAVGRNITDEALARFFTTAKNVLIPHDSASTSNVNLGAATASIGELSACSPMLRRGFLETMVLLSFHSQNLFGPQIDFDVRRAASEIIKGLLTPLALEKLTLSQEELPLYAQAAPELFLGIIERDLRTQPSLVKTLMFSVHAAALETAPGTGLLRALKVLGRNETFFVPVLRILGELSGIGISDDSADQPIEALCELLHPSSPNDTRNAEVIDLLLEEQPEVGWRVCMRLFDDEIARFPTAAESENFFDPVLAFDQAMPPALCGEFIESLAALALERPSYSFEMLRDLVSVFQIFAPDEQDQIWELITEWSNRSEASGEKRAELREAIREEIISRVEHWEHFYEDEKAEIMEEARRICADLAPEMTVNNF